MKGPSVTVLGAGALGAAMAARLGEIGHQVNLWNRTPDRARAAATASTGVTAVADLLDAVKQAPVILTVLRDGDAVAEVMNTAVDGLDTRAVWVQASTIGPDSARMLGELARTHAVAYLDAPVSGSTGPARNGTLVWLTSGSREAFELAEPTLRQLGSAVEYLGSGVEGSAVKIAVNAWMTSATVAMSDVLSLCDALGIDHELFARVVSDGPLAMPYAQQKATAMDGHAYTAGFAVELARKDLALAEESLPPSPLLLAVRRRLDQAIADGHGHDDLAAVDYRRGQPG
ncbi:MAG: 3-hydroxyisobutyrate dehydrogenase [Nocardioidaceae bacterium]|jgi:3-hydroxyisobutyrate dehydrogenase|nr:3-hydroxyisobutyrate dehydrogenase [Nocardioidaceae bacterium]